jgi:pimeloyl-ACP methyl ester carboxylesterase
MDELKVNGMRIVDIMDRAEAIPGPALIVCGEDDWLTPVKHSRFLHQRIPGSELRVIEDAGHMVMWEQPREVNEHIREFLRGA